MISENGYGKNEKDIEEESKTTTSTPYF